MSEMRIEHVPLSEIRRWPRNPKLHAHEEIERSAERFGWTQPLLRDERTGQLVAGHGRLETLQRMKAAGKPPPERVQERDGEWLVPVVRGVSFKDDREAEAYLLADNRLQELGGWDEAGLAAMISDLKGIDDGLAGTGWDVDPADFAAVGSGQPSVISRTQANATLAERFGVPPFSVLDARQGYWQDRKHAWIALGIRSELGRGENLLRMSDTVLEPDPEKRAQAKKPGANAKGVRPGGASDAASRQKEYKGNEHLTEAARRSLGVYQSYGGADAIKRGQGKPTWRGSYGPSPSTDPVSQKIAAAQLTGTSIFDPVLCELAVRWFSPPAGTVLDPFAGGSVRGIVSSKLGRSYIGVDLSKDQVEANREQAKAICTTLPHPEWVCGDSLGLASLLPGAQADLVFSCPPYADLEVYSEDPRDLSAMAYPDFCAAYREIIKGACALLKEDRFACFVVGEVRGPDGAYRNFVGETTAAFQAAGLAYYNEAILVTSIGSLSIRAGGPFAGSRKLGKTHQNVLVFVKGDPKKAAQACGLADFGADLAPEEEAPAA